MADAREEVDAGGSPDLIITLGGDRTFSTAEHAWPHGTTPLSPECAVVLGWGWL
ncbi:hypothetical protein [Streptomyces sp. NPDC048516]|uniref:hypothetical protein n=1 Tax=Streptomyces sp. NPDC048516 TaxID=3365565 RepID=UPI0037186190